MFIMKFINIIMKGKTTPIILIFTTAAETNAKTTLLNVKVPIINPLMFRIDNCNSTAVTYETPNPNIEIIVTT